jgi:hypothetical protein
MSLDPLHRLLAINALAGAVIGLIAVVGLFVLDVGKLQSLAMRDSAGFIALAALGVGFIVTFASVLMGTAIMSMKRRDDDDDHHGGHGAHLQLRPIQVRARR